MHQWRPLSVDRVVWSFGVIQISTSGSLCHWIPRSPGSWASQVCLAGAKKGRTQRGRETPIPGGALRQSSSLFSFRLYTPLDSYRAERGRETPIPALTRVSRVSMGAFHLTQNSGSFGWYTKWNGPFRFGPTGISGTSFEGGPRWSVWSFRSTEMSLFNLTKLLSPVPLLCILLTRTITKRAVAWDGSVQPECTVPLGTWNFRNFKPEFLFNEKRPRCANLLFSGFVSFRVSGFWVLGRESNCLLTSHFLCFNRRQRSLRMLAWPWQVL